MQPQKENTTRNQKAKEKNELTRRLAELIKEARLKKGMSQEELAHEAGYYRTYVGHIENATYSPSVYTVWRLAKALGVELEEILKGL